MSEAKVTTALNNINQEITDYMQHTEKTCRTIKYRYSGSKSNIASFISPKVVNSTKVTSYKVYGDE